MTSTPKTLHNDLHIDFINGSCTDINRILKRGQHKRSLNSLDIQHFIRCLCTHDGRTLDTFCGTYCDRITVIIQLCIRYGLPLCLKIFHIFSEHLTDPCDIRSVSADKCRGFKGPDTGLCQEIIRIHHNTSIQTVRLNIADVN